MKYRGVFVDDQDDVFAEQLSTPGRLDIEFQEILELTELARAIAEKTPMLVALDYRLDEVPTGLAPNQTFKGSALAQHLRDVSIEKPDSDFAIILVSAEAKIRTLYRPDQTAHDLFDRVYVKEEINTRRAAVRAELLSLCMAYEHLRGKNGQYDLAELMKANDDDRSAIDIQALTLRLTEAKAPHLAAKLVLSQLIDRPGPLIDLAEACAHLGVDQVSGSKVAEILKVANADYRGLFSDAWPRWWTHRVEGFAQDFFGARATGLPASTRTALLRERFGVDLQPAISPWTNSADELIAFACACCRRGTEMKHSVSVFEAYLPRFAKRRRICWDCVQTDKCHAGTLALVVDEIDASLAAEVRTKPRPGSAPQEAE